MATLTVTDTGDGSGATATVAASSGGANGVYYAAVDGSLGAVTWSLGGSRVGDGAVPLALPKGYYWAYCLTGTAASNLVYFQVTDGADAVITCCFNAVKATIQLLNQPFSVRVYDSQFAGNQPAIEYPCTVLTSEDGQDSDEAALNGRDDLGHPVRVQIMVHCVKFDNSIKDTLRAYRQAVFRAFHNQRLSGVTESVRNRVELGGIAMIRGDAPLANSELTVRCVTREVRGLGQ
ncbi:hypothetical protein [Gemmata sp.]|uniref:hypothetical protein n=1 Tax=Gemmata sp. TaxID=1914242 RepID=UPI003F729EA4